MDSAEQLQRIYLAGFELQTFDRFPKAVGVVRGECIALLEATPGGLTMIGTPGWRMGEVMAHPRRKPKKVTVTENGTPSCQSPSPSDDGAST